MTPSPTSGATSGLPPGITPTKDTWSEFWDSTYKCYYYSNVITEEVKWEKPTKYDHIIPDEDHPHSDEDDDNEGEGTNVARSEATSWEYDDYGRNLSTLVALG